MARPQAGDYAERREAIVAAAAALFARHGFDGTGVAGIAAACGASKSLIYHYFPGKEDILHAVMAGHIEALAAAARTAAAAPDHRLRTLIGAFMALYAGAAARQKVLLNELHNLAPDHRDEVRALQRGLIATVEAMIVETAPALAADPARLRAAAMMLFGIINWTHTWYDPAGPVAPAAFADMAAALAEGGLPALVNPRASLPAPRRTASATRSSGARRARGDRSSG